MIASYRFDSSIRSVFYGVDDPNKPEGPFNNTLRMLLVDDILANLISTGDGFNQSLGYMISNGYIEDAFILHDQTSDSRHMTNLFNFIEKSLKKEEELSEEIIKNYMEALKHFKKHDHRKFLNERWAKFRTFLRFQPMWQIRNYFGEEFSFYFAWIGCFISTLWVLAILGIGFCVLGVV